MRAWVCSTVPLNVSTFELTVPTSVRTYFLVAQAGAMATVTASNEVAIRLFRILTFLLNDYLARRGHVPASRVYYKVFLPGPNLERVPTRNETRLEGDEILVAQLAKQIVDCGERVLGHAADPHIASRPPGQVRQRSNVGLLAGGSNDRQLAARVIERVDDRQEIHGHVNRAGNTRDLRSFHLAAGIHAIGDHQHRAMLVLALANGLRRRRNGVVERGHAPWPAC